MIVYHYAGCSTCKKALKWLADRDVAVTTIDLVAAPPSVKTLKDLWQRSNQPISKLFNVSGMSYRDGGFKDRLPGMTDADKLAALAADGKLVKRPIFDLGPERGKTVLIGFAEAAWADALG